MSFKGVHFYNISDYPIYGEWFTDQWVDFVAPSLETLKTYSLVKGPHGPLFLRIILDFV